MRVLYLDCFAGISGDMILGGLIDLGVDLIDIEDALKGLKISDYSIGSDKVRRGGIVSTRFIVDVKEREQPHRAFSEVRHIIQQSGLPEDVKKKSLFIFERLALAEAKIHGVDADEVVFHEIGGVDSIIDVVGTVVALDLLGVKRVYASPLPLGSGFIDSDHGCLPVPAPATLEILKDYPVLPSRIEGEMTTPTGAAIVTCLSKGEMPSIKIKATGYGAGERDIEGFPNLLRVILGEEDSESNLEKLKVVESNIDDLPPYTYEYIIERLLDEGALDVSMTPIHMKKNRPAVLLWTLCKKENEERIIKTIFSETTTIGLRSYEVERYSLSRRIEDFVSSYGKVRIKISGIGDTLHLQPEYEDCKRIAEREDIPLRYVMESVMEEYKNKTTTRGS